MDILLFGRSAGPAKCTGEDGQFTQRLNTHEKNGRFALEDTIFFFFTSACSLSPLCINRFTSNRLYYFAQRFKRFDGYLFLSDSLHSPCQMYFFFIYSRKQNKKKLLHTTHILAKDRNSLRHTQYSVYCVRVWLNRIHTRIYVLFI